MEIIELTEGEPAEIGNIPVVLIYARRGRAKLVATVNIEESVEDLKIYAEGQRRRFKSVDKRRPVREQWPKADGQPSD